MNGKITTSVNVKNQSPKPLAARSHAPPCAMVAIAMEAIRVGSAMEQFGLSVVDPGWSTDHHESDR
jgi:hypothetical protein